MPAFCAVYGCGARGGGGNKDSLKFFRIPKVKMHQGDQTRELSEKRRRLWISAIGRGDSKEFGQHARVCSRHFVSGKSAKDWEATSIDWVPNCNLGLEKIKEVRTAGLPKKTKERQKRRDKRAAIADGPTSKQSNIGAFQSKILQRQIYSHFPPVTVTNQGQHAPTRDVNLKNKEVSSQTDLTGQYIDCLLFQDWRLHNEVDRENGVTQKSLEGHDEQVQFYTGIPTYPILMSIFDFISPYLFITPHSTLSKFQYLMIAFMRLKLNLSEYDLAFRFDVAESTISAIFELTLDVLFARLDHLIVWPEREVLCSNRPAHFQESFDQRVAVITNCFDIFIDQSSKNNSSTRSQTIHHDSIKYLMGITPQGAIVYLSNAWIGGTSDRYLTENCGLLTNLEPGDVVIAEGGLNIDTTAQIQFAEVKPPNDEGPKQLSVSTEVKGNIDNVRIHVERCIRNAGNKYKIMSGVIPFDYVDSTDTDGFTTLDKIIRLSCALTNLSDSIE